MNTLILASILFHLPVGNYSRTDVIDHTNPEDHFVETCRLDVEITQAGATPTSPDDPLLSLFYYREKDWSCTEAAGGGWFPSQGWNCNRGFLSKGTLVHQFCQGGSQCSDPEVSETLTPTENGFTYNYRRAGYHGGEKTCIYRYNAGRG